MRLLLAAVLVLHGLAHVGVGMWSADAGVVWLHTISWLAAILGLVLAGIGLAGAPLVRSWWELGFLVGIAGSFALLLQRPHWVGGVGIGIDLVLLIVWLRWRAPLARMVSGLRAATTKRAPVVQAIAVVTLAYLAGALALRPWHMRWGTTRTERGIALPGDELAPAARYRIDHAVTITAPADSVWPWLAQIGQDRGGFYSYTWLENLIGADVHNASSIVPAWQERHEGELVRAVPPDWLGGRFGRDIGWRIALLDPGRAMVLKGWGAFVLVPVDAQTTRMIVRTRGEGRPSLGGTVLAPLGLLIFEPAHFIMQRRMLLGIKERAEHRHGAPRS